MGKKKASKKPFNLGDAEFQKKLSVYYSWIAPVIIFIYSIALFIDRAFLTGIIILSLSVFLLPLLKQYTSRIPKLIRVMIVLGLIGLAFVSMNLYI